MKNDPMYDFVVKVDSDDFTRSRLFACVYCGDTTQKTRDHIVSVSWSGHKRSYARGDTVPACRECNLLLGDAPIHCIGRRAYYLSQKIEYKYRKILSHPFWSDEELKEMSSQFKFLIKSSNHLKQYITSRITHCLKTSFESEFKFKQKEFSEVIVYRILNECFLGKDYKDIEEEFELQKGYISEIIRLKKFASVVIAFKYEKKIPFDASLSRVFNLIRKNNKLIKGR